MNPEKPKNYIAEFKESAVKLVAKTARDLCINKNILHTWISKYRHPKTPSMAFIMYSTQTVWCYRLNLLRRC